MDEAGPGSRLYDILVQVYKLGPTLELTITDQVCHYLGKLAMCFRQERVPNITISPSAVQVKIEYMKT